VEADEYTVQHWVEKKIWTHLDWKMHRNRLEKIASFLEGEMSQFLDVGCALGHATARLRELCGGTWTGIDTSVAAVKKAAELFPDIEFHFSGPGLAGDYIDVGRFDGVVCSEVIEHVPDDQALANYLVRSTKSVLVVTTPARDIKDPGHLRLYTEGGLKELFNGQDIMVERDRHFFYLILKGDGHAA
jgi:2-polyprenyl-3-methyl-5-hydroxy-6-metoxy-1,4-benzoquinol methylase